MHIHNARIFMLCTLCNLLLIPPSHLSSQKFMMAL